MGKSSLRTQKEQKHLEISITYCICVVPHFNFSYSAKYVIVKVTYA